MPTPEIWPGARVLVFDPSLYRDDRSTPLSVTMRPATVVRRYARRGRFGIYPDLVAVKFDHREQVSEAHFTSCVQLISEARHAD